MLQEKNKKEYLSGCFRLGITIFVLFLLVITGFIFYLIIFFFIFAWKKKTNINFQKVLEKLWVYDCFKYFFWEFKTKEILKKYEDKFNKYEYKFNKNKRKNEYIEKIRKQNFEIKLKNLEELWKNKKEEPKNQQDGFSPLFIKSEKTIKKVKYKSENNSFNSWKSIWDNYESVIDIMNKNK